MPEHATSPRDIRTAASIALRAMIRARDAMQVIDEDLRPTAPNGALIDALLDILITDTTDYIATLHN